MARGEQRRPSGRRDAVAEGERSEGGRRWAAPARELELELGRVLWLEFEGRAPAAVPRDRPLELPARLRRCRPARAPRPHRPRGGMGSKGRRRALGGGGRGGAAQGEGWGAGRARDGVVDLCALLEITFFAMAMYFLCASQINECNPHFAFACWSRSK